MESLTVLRRLAEHHNYSNLHEACLACDSREPAVQVLLALARAHLGDTSGAHRIRASLDPGSLGLDARVDLAAVHIALGELDQAIAILESGRQENGNHALLLARLAWCRLQQGQHDIALALYVQSLTIRPMLAVYHSLLRLYRDDGRLADMERCLDQAWRFWAAEQYAWPEAQRSILAQQLRSTQLDLWLEQEHFEEAEAWVEQQRTALGEDEWCMLLSGFAQRLAARDRHPQAEEWLRTGIRHCPENPMLHRQLAELAQLQGRSLQAVALLRRAIRLADAREEATVPLWVRLSATILPANPRLAREAIEQAGGQLARIVERTTDGASQISEWNAQIVSALADVEAQDQDYTAAEQHYRQVLDDWPDMIPALHGLGQIFMQLGRLDEAAQLFERVRAIDPTRGYGALITARRFPEDEETLVQIEQLARRPGLEGSVRTGLLFQLAAAWEKREKYDRAFALVDEANTASRRLLNYDPKAHRRYCARIRHAFPGALYEHRADCGHESTLPVFVVGMPRSGTTLVEQIIAGHSRICGAGELGAIPRVIAGLERWERRTGSGRGYPDCVDDLDPAVIRGIAEDILQELRGYAPDADHVVDKLPHNFENIGMIGLLFPNVKIISVRRDPRDIAVSNYFTDYAGKHGGMGFAYDLDWIGEQLADHNLLMHHWQQVFPYQILEVEYEALVDEPEAGARRMLDHIGVDWEPGVLEFQTLQRPVKTASAWQVRQPLYATSKARWQRHQPYLKPLINATNRKIDQSPIRMVTLPEPGWLNLGVDCYRQGDLDSAERRFKQLLHHLPEHAAAGFMLGLIFVRKGHSEGIQLMEKAVERCPWNGHWRRDLAQAYRLNGREQDADVLMSGPGSRTASHPDAEPDEGAPDIHLDYLYLSGETAC